MATSLGDVMTVELAEQLLALADGPAVRGIAVLGSVARGDASPWSDVDVESTVAEPSAKWKTRPSFIGPRLVMSSSITSQEQWAQLRLADKAIWAVPAYEAMRILLDRDGELGRLQAACRAFDYEALRPAAVTYIRDSTAAACEYVFKIRDGLERDDESKVLHAAASLIGKCERIVSVAGLVPIPTENAYYRLIQAWAGPAWTALHRSAYGLDGGDAFAQATAAARLLRETVRLVAERLDAGTRAVVDRTIGIVP